MNDHCVTTILESPLGPFQLFSSGQALIGILLPAQVTPKTRQLADTLDPILRDACGELQAYLDGGLKQFTVPHKPPIGTEFQHDVWDAVRKIPYGKTTSYSELAHRVGRPKAIRAVGVANGKNPLPIIVPCHRVIGLKGSLKGYAGGVELKLKLLQLEAKLFE